MGEASPINFKDIEEKLAQDVLYNAPLPVHAVYRVVHQLWHNAQHDGSFCWKQMTSNT